MPLVGYAPHHQIAFGDGVLYCGQAKAKPEAQLGESKAKKEPRRGAVGGNSQPIPTVLHTNNNPKPHAQRGLGLK